MLLKLKKLQRTPFYARFIFRTYTLQFEVYFSINLHGCPSSFLEIAKTLRKITYQDIPPYKSFMEKLKQDLPYKVRMTDPYEWSKITDKIYEDGETSKSEKAEAEKDGNNDQSTVSEVEESIITEERNSQYSVDYDDFAKEDTLDGL